MLIEHYDVEPFHIEVGSHSYRKLIINSLDKLQLKGPQYLRHEIFDNFKESNLTKAWGNLDINLVNLKE